VSVGTIIGADIIANAVIPRANTEIAATTIAINANNALAKCVNEIEHVGHFKNATMPASNDVNHRLKTLVPLKNSRSASR
jgi:hypothetical protein